MSNTNLNTHLVFYDDACPLCSKEIAHYQKLETIEDIRWVPIHQDTQTLENLNLDKEKLLKTFHVYRADGEWVTGAAAFATIWYSIKRYHFAGVLAYKLKLITPLNFFYKYFAEWRYKKSSVCSIK